ncbi:VOC family protein [Methanoregula sp.]|uniref:VOC family protein n=1 Tax=Methanoregula sp. TaxID=2052170 RepID=UPI00236B2C35|nr:VOC family protein [Methanoregula sp.]MDD1686304.1 glyoxalase/bleomycin resistance/dioxygenase family protein [Methanoregula sp.]
MAAQCKLTAFVLMVKDMDVSRKFYESVLRQEVAMDHSLNVGYTSGLALWQQDYALNVIHGRTVKPEKGNDVEVYFESANVDDAYASVRSYGAEIVHGIREQPWGQRVFRFHDPDGFVIEIGEPMDALVRRLNREGMTEAEIGKKTTLPAGIVRAILG